jgi:hypothetical protein
VLHSKIRELALARIANEQAPKLAGGKAIADAIVCQMLTRLASPAE